MCIKKALDFNGMGRPPIRKADTYNVLNFAGKVNRKDGAAANCLCGLKCRRNFKSHAAF
jgi:hypothetical protein